MSTETPDAHFGADVAVVGAGPAGLAAAAEAASAGASVLLIDAAQQFGGQYWRHADEHSGLTVDSRWHHGWGTYTALASAVRTAIRARRVRYLAGAQVWSAQARTKGDGGFVVHTAPVAELVVAESGSAARGTGAPARHVVRSLILCPGAYDRQLPVPGWTLPGVMAAGGVQAFIKTQGVAPGRRVIFAGTGPFLLSAAASTLQAGAQVRGIAEAAGPGGWFPRGVTAALVPSKAREAVEYISLLLRHRVRYRMRTAITAIHGQDRVEAATISRLDSCGLPRPGSQELIEGIDVVGLGWGFVPQAELLLQLGARTGVGRDGSLIGIVDSDQQTSIEHLFLAGEITGVAGAVAAVAEGRIAGRTAAGRARGVPVGRSAKDRLRRSTHRVFAHAMHHAHPVPPQWQAWLNEDTIVCRCEEVPWGRVNTAAEDLGAHEPRALKGTTRTGMGWCQGRMCAVAAVCVARSGDVEDRPTSRTDPRAAATTQAALAATARRPVATPITFTTMAGAAPAPIVDEVGGSDPHPEAQKEQR